ncbi:MAG: DUF4854 domain-containing protein [Firmicutes bacterium]|nr:DUF4854 domain-containing protein [Bacillota bacterium]
MKKKNLLIILLIAAVAAAMLFTACSKSSNESAQSAEAAEEASEAVEETTEAVEEANEPAETGKTLEQYMADNPDVWEASVATAEKTDGLKLEVKENSLIYNYDLGTLGFTSGSMAKDAKAALDAGLENGASTFSSVCETLEKETGVEGIITTVNYCWEDEIISTRSFMVDGAL